MRGFGGGFGNARWRKERIQQVCRWVKDHFHHGIAHRFPSRGAGDHDRELVGEIDVGLQQGGNGQDGVLANKVREHGDPLAVVAAPARLLHQRCSEGEESVDAWLIAGHKGRGGQACLGEGFFLFQLVLNDGHGAG